MAEAEALLHFPNLRSERMIVKDVRDPSGEIPTVGVPRLNIMRSNFQ